MKARLFEEINLLYVALTRAKGRVYVPADCVPAGFPAHADVQPTHGTGVTVLLKKAVVAPITYSTQVSYFDSTPAALDPRFASLQQKLGTSGK